MPKKISKFQQMCASAKAVLDENALAQGLHASKWRRSAHFWVLVWRSFVRNRCPVRASALAYASLLALIPMLAVVVSVTSTFLKKEGEERIDQFIEKMVATLTPPANLDTNGVSAMDDSFEEAPGTAAETNNNSVSTNSGSTALPSLSHKRTNHADTEAFEDQKTVAARKSMAHRIHEFIQRTRSGTLGVTGSIALIFVAISMLSRIESTLNDIWGVEHGRTWFMRIVLYWGVLSLAPLLLVVALGLATGPHLHSTEQFLATLPVIGTFIVKFGFQLLPIVVLCITFGAFYMLMPNAKVHWRAALVGGFVASLLFHLNNLISVLYVSRVVSNSKIYGSVGLVPVLMIGLYLSWLILLFGGQVAYAVQNRRTYLEEKQVENINQRGREFVALRLMTLIGQRFLRGEPPCDVTEMAEELSVPTRLIRQIMQTLAAARLVVETAETGYLPSRPMETISCHDILLAMRSSQGQELATRDEPTRKEVYGEYQRIEEAERHAASSVTMLALATRAQAQVRQIEASTPALES
jgi:membrane protein